MAIMLTFALFPASTICICIGASLHKTDFQEIESFPKLMTKSNDMAIYSSDIDLVKNIITRLRCMYPVSPEIKSKYSHSPRWPQSIHSKCRWCKTHVPAKGTATKIHTRCERHPLMKKHTR